MTTKRITDDSLPERQQQGDSYDRWFNDRVETAMASKEPGKNHDDVMEEARQVIAEAKKRRKHA